MQKLSLLLLSCWLGSATALLGQSQLSLHFMPMVPQAQESQPAYMPPRSLTFALPNLSLELRNSGFAYRDLVQTIPGSDSLRLDIGGVINGIDDRHDIRFNGQAELLQIGFRIKGLSLGVGVKTRWEAGLGLPKSLLALAWEGNAPFVDQQLELAPLIQARAWQEISARGAIRLLDKLQVGVRLAYLTGLADVSSQTGSSLRLRTDAKYYQLEAAADYTLRTSILDLGDLNALQTLDPQLGLRPFTKNSGVSADLGIVFDVTPRLQLSASAVDLGFIRWKDQAQLYHIGGQIDFDGLDIAEVWSDSFQVEKLVDSLMGGISVSQTAYSYATLLPARTFISARYKLLNLLHLGALWQTQHYHGKSYHALALHSSVQIRRWLGLGLTYNMQQRRYDQIGLGLQLTGGPVMFYLASDNALAFIRPEQARHTNIRLGMNVVLGKQDI